MLTAPMPNPAEPPNGGREPLRRSAPAGHVVPIGSASQRLLDYLREHLICVAINELSGLVHAGAITVNGAKAGIDQPLAALDRIAVDPERLIGLRTEGRWIQATELAVDVVYEDEDLLVLNKAAGMHVHPLGRFREETIVNAMAWRAGARAWSPWGEWRPNPAHRLDRPASGLVAIAKSGAIRDSFRKLLEDGKVHRGYLARVIGRVEKFEGMIDAPIGEDPEDDYRFAVVPEDAGGQHARTRYVVVDRKPTSTLLAVALETGRTHQIRVHLASIGHPIEGDTLYTGGPGAKNSPMIRLHAASLVFPHPRTGGAIHLTSAPSW